MSTFVHVRILDDAFGTAQSALNSGETIELRTRHGEILRGRVCSMQYIVGLDQGWFVVFEVENDQVLSYPIGGLLS